MSAVNPGLDFPLFTDFIGEKSRLTPGRERALPKAAQMSRPRRRLLQNVQAPRIPEP